MSTVPVSAPTSSLGRHKFKAAAVAAGVTLGGLALTGAGVYAGLNAVATGTGSVASGTISLTVGAEGGSAGFPQTVTGMVPGDIDNTYVTLTNGSSSDITAQDLTLQVAGTPANSTLITPPAADGTTGIEVAVNGCSVAWVVSPTANTATCGGTTTPLLAATPVATLATTPGPLVSGTVAPGAVYRLQVQLILPSSLNETTTNGTTPSSSIQGQTLALNYTFNEVQRTATTTNS
ncbi:MAG TPA: hypothetical protein VFP61_01830 [Acidimicrobiales bacterium]|nr:hypothetical protein [Acidimicrobiales bacterium]